MVNVCAAFSVVKVSRINMVDRVSKHVQSKISGKNIVLGVSSVKLTNTSFNA